MAHLHGKFVISVTGDGNFTDDVEKSLEDLEGMLEDVVRAFKKRNPDLQCESVSS